MSQAIQERLQAISRSMLTPLVRQALDSPQAEVLEWQYEPLAGGVGHLVAGTLGIYRFFGLAQIQDQMLPWALVLKAVSGTAETGNSNLRSENYWKREVLVYQSGLLEGLSGELVAPRCYDVIAYPDEEYWIWMEYISESTPRIWPLQRYKLAARHLGQFNANSLGRPLPDYPWFSRGTLREWVEPNAPILQELHHWVQQPHSWLTAGDADRILRLYAAYDQLLEALERLPHCLCHHDAFRRNLLARRLPGGTEQTVAIDWSVFGTGAIGVDLAPLVYLSLTFLEITSDPRELDVLVFEGYMAGLHAAGWRGDEATVRFAYTATAALTQGVGGIVGSLPKIEETEFQTFLQELTHAPLDVILAQWRRMNYFLLDLGEEALTLLRRGV